MDDPGSGQKQHIIYERECLYCGAIVRSLPKTKPRKFCDDQCRARWWSKHRDQLQHRDDFRWDTGTCAACGEEFTAPHGKHTEYKYCSRACYYSRRWGGPAGERPVEEKPVQYLAEDSAEEEFYLRRVFLVMRSSNLFSWGIDGLGAWIQCELGMDVFDGDAFVFVNQARSSIKLLQWEGDGFKLLRKRLEAGRFPWPARTDHGVVEISLEDFDLFLEYPSFLLRMAGTKLKPEILI